MVVQRKLILPLASSVSRHITSYPFSSSPASTIRYNLLFRENNNKNALLAHSQLHRQFYSSDCRGPVINEKQTDFKSIKYWTENKGRVAHVMLNRPEALNAIDHHMPIEIEKAIKIANFDESVKVILLYGAGGAFCSGYDLRLFSEGKRGEMMGSQPMPWCPLIDFRYVSSCKTIQFFLTLTEEE